MGRKCCTIDSWATKYWPHLIASYPCCGPMGRILGQTMKKQTLQKRPVHAGHLLRSIVPQPHRKHIPIPSTTVSHIFFSGCKGKFWGPLPTNSLAWHLPQRYRQWFPSLWASSVKRIQSLSPISRPRVSTKNCFQNAPHKSPDPDVFQAKRRFEKTFCHHVVTL